MARPRKYNSPDEMQEAVVKYFETVKLERRPPTICGLALHLGFVSRNSLLDYEGYDEGFFCIIKAAKTKIEMYHEEQLGAKHHGGHIFWLKANANWKDTTVTEHGITNKLQEFLEQLDGKISKPPGEDKEADV